MDPLPTTTNVTATRPRPGGGDAFDDYYRELWGDVVRYLARRDERDHAEELASEVFLVAWQRHKTSGSLPELPWLIVTARNLLLNRARGDRRRMRLAERAQRSVEEASRRSQWEPGADLVGRELLEVVRSELDDLDGEIVLLTAWEQLSSTEIATVVGLAPEAVRQRLARARRRLRAALADHPADQKDQP